MQAFSATKFPLGTALAMYLIDFYVFYFHFY